MKKLIKLDFGGGTIKREGFISVDKFGNPDVKHDLDSFPYPFENNSVDKIYIFHALKHLKEPLDFLDEAYRILKISGMLHIKVPHWSDKTAYQNFGHRNFYDEDAIDWITTKSGSDLSLKKRWKLIEK